MCWGCVRLPPPYLECFVFSVDTLVSCAPGAMYLDTLSCAPKPLTLGSQDHRELSCSCV